jgi:hypothetical protein
MNTLQEQVLKEEREQFTIDNLEGATWAFRKLRAIKAKEDEFKKVADEEINKIRTWLESELKATQSDREYFEGILTEYYQNERQKNSKFKLSTPYGKVSSRKTDKYIYEDEQAIKDYCNVNQLDCIRVKEELDKTAFKKICKDGINQETGEIVPGVRVEKVESISVKVE